MVAGRLTVAAPPREVLEPREGSGREVLEGRDRELGGAEREFLEREAPGVRLLVFGRVVRRAVLL